MEARQKSEHHAGGAAATSPSTAEVEVDVEMEERTDEEHGDIAGIPSEAEVAGEDEAGADGEAPNVLAAAEAEAAAELAAAEAEAVNICSVCSLPWTSNGAHRICCVPCGHVFGRSCLENSLEGQISAPCPTCNQQFGLHGIVTLVVSTQMFENCCDLKALKAQMLQDFGRSMAQYRSDLEAELQTEEKVLWTELDKEMNRLYSHVMCDVDVMLSSKK